MMTDDISDDERDDERDDEYDDESDDESDDENYDESGDESFFFCRRCTPFINKIIKKLHCDRRRAFHGVTSQVPEPTCFWKWVGRTNPQKKGILTLEVSFSTKKIKIKPSQMEV